MNWLSMFSVFAKPLGAMINNAISAAAGATVVYAANKGISADITTPIVASIAFAISSAISAFAATQGVQIPIINADPTNGVKVVSSKAAAPAVNEPNPERIP